VCVCVDVGSTGAVQNLRIVQGADGQIQVQGLLPGRYYEQLTVVIVTHVLLVIIWIYYR